MSAVLTSAQLARDLAITDLSDLAEGPPHAIQLLAELAVSALAETSSMSKVSSLSSTVFSAGRFLRSQV